MTDKSKIISTLNIYQEKQPIKDSFVHQIFKLYMENIIPTVYNNRIIYNKQPDGLKLYGRNENNFEKIQVGSIIDIEKDFSEKYSKYTNFILIIGQNDCVDYTEPNSEYRIIDYYNINYFSISEFNGYYRIPISLQDINQKSSFDYIFDYGKQYLKNNIYFVTYNLLGNIDTISYYNEFKDNIFEGNTTTLKDYEIINDNKQHLIILRINSSNNYQGYFDFFSEVDYSSQIIYLNKTSINNYIIPKNKNYTFNYENAEMIKIELIDNNIKPIIYFENNLQNFNNDNIITIKNSKNDFKLLYIGTPSSSSASIRITTSVSLNNLEKANLENLYKYEDKYIYNYNPNNINKVEIIFKPKSNNLRLLKEENSDNSDIKICYNIGNMIILEENGYNCFILENSYTLDYKFEFGYNVYLTFYSNNNSKEFVIEQINESKKETENPTKPDDDNTTLIVVLVVVGVVILAGIGVVLFLRFKNKKVSSDDIENSN